MDSALSAGTKRARKKSKHKREYFLRMLNGYSGRIGVAGKKLRRCQEKNALGGIDRFRRRLRRVRFLSGSRIECIPQTDDLSPASLRRRGHAFHKKRRISDHPAFDPLR